MSAVQDKIHYGNTVLKGTQKSGELKPDKNGYYTCVLGALGVLNSVNEEYVNTQKARSTFDSNSALVRRINEGLLRGEYAHPDPSYYPNMMLFDRRVRTIKEDRVSHHISDIMLENINYQGYNTLGILGKIKPCGPFGNYLRESLDNPNENVTFSGRYFSNVSKQNGTIQREIHTVVTWDYVSVPGIQVASKYASPTLESFGEAIFYSAMYQAMVNGESPDPETTPSNEISMESGANSTSEVITPRQILDDFGFLPKRTGKPVSFKW